MGVALRAREVAEIISYQRDAIGAQDIFNIKVSGTGRPSVTSLKHAAGKRAAEHTYTKMSGCRSEHQVRPDADGANSRIAEDLRRVMAESAEELHD